MSVRDDVRKHYRYFLLTERSCISCKTELCGKPLHIIGNNVFKSFKAKNVSISLACRERCGRGSQPQSTRAAERVFAVMCSACQSRPASATRNLAIGLNGASVGSAALRRLDTQRQASTTTHKELSRAYVTVCNAACVNCCSETQLCM